VVDPAVSDRVGSQEYDEAWGLVYETLMSHTALVGAGCCTCGHVYNRLSKESILSHNAAMVVNAMADRVGMST
jgi:hypothetical protein